MARIQYQCHLHRLLLDAASPPSATGSKPKNSYTADANFDSNMVIILAALLCALICALGLNSIVRCALRCGRRFRDEDPERVGSRLALTGLKKESLSQIPVAAYKSGIGIPATDCPICLGEFVEGEKVRILPKCRHSFHVKCVDTWLDSHSSCPTCRQLLLFDAPEDGQVRGEIATCTELGLESVFSVVFNQSLVVENNEESR